MKNFTLAIISIALMAATPIFAQKKSESEKSDAVVTIKVNGKEQDIEEYFEQWGEEFGRRIEQVFDDNHFSIEIDNDDFDIDIDADNIHLGELAESIADVITEAVANMTITLTDVDPDDLDDDGCSFRGEKNLNKVMDEIEDKYGSPVKNIDKMTIKIREEEVKIDMDLTLENGRKIQKTKIYAD